MPVLSVLTDPTRPVLTETAVRQAAGEHARAAPRWLSPGAAAEVDVAVGTELSEQLWSAWQDKGVDLVLQPDGERRRPLLVADMDSTMIEQECIDELAACAGAGDEVAAITARAMDGGLDFEEALRARVVLLRGLSVDVVHRVLDERITLAPGGAALVATVKARGGYAALVSGGFTLFTRVVSDWLGFDEHHGNTLEVQDGRLTGTVLPPIVGKEAKVTALREISARMGLTPAASVAVGDGANDLPMLHLAGTGIALHAKPSVAQAARIRVNHGDLTAALYLQGYADEDIVRPS